LGQLWEAELKEASRIHNPHWFLCALLFLDPRTAAVIKLVKTSSSLHIFANKWYNKRRQTQQPGIWRHMTAYASCGGELAAQKRDYLIQHLTIPSARISWDMWH